ncbi:hypothetical protein OIU78_029306 [Salix suchowensis]|nr:hypothetical protein OIU78_029306 [Salix suchowensis]
MSSAMMKSAISLLLLAMVVTENGATVVLPALDPSCPPLTANLNACFSAENVAAITVATSPVPPQCCQGLQNIVAGNATVNLCQDAICQCFTEFCGGPNSYSTGFTTGLCFSQSPDKVQRQHWSQCHRLCCLIPE